MAPIRIPSAASLCLTLLSLGCATTYLPPPTAVLDRARATRSYSARLRVKLRGPDMRARTQALIAFRRPDAVRLEVPGGMGLRLVAVIRQGELTAVFPGERAVFRGPAEPAELLALLGVDLSPAELMDLLVGLPSPRLRSYQARWGEALPREVKAVLPDGSQLELKIEAPETGTPFSSQVFEPPPHEGFRRVQAAEARGLWRGR
jgi:hypothetical protein